MPTVVNPLVLVVAQERKNLFGLFFRPDMPASRERVIKSRKRESFMDGQKMPDVSGRYESPSCYCDSCDPQVIPQCRFL